MPTLRAQGSSRALVVSDNCDIYGTVDDLIARSREDPTTPE